MDIRVSQKEQMMQPGGAVDIITNGINDFFLKESTDIHGQKWIEDIEVITDFIKEEKDRVVFAVIRQRGQDPMAPGEGIQWAESMLSEIPIPLLMQQIVDAVVAESDYVNVAFETMIVNGQEQLAIRFNTIGTSRIISEAAYV
jgi:hypothetical protein